MTTSRVPVHAVTLCLILKTAMKVRANATIRAATRTTNWLPALINAAVLAYHASLLMTPENSIVARHAVDRNGPSIVPLLTLVPNLMTLEHLIVEGHAVDRKS